MIGMAKQSSYQKRKKKEAERERVRRIRESHTTTPQAEEMALGVDAELDEILSVSMDAVDYTHQVSDDYAQATVDSAVKAFISQQGLEPMRPLERSPLSWAVPQQCHTNAAAAVHLGGGRVVTGWHCSLNSGRE